MCRDPGDTTRKVSLFHVSSLLSILKIKKMLNLFRHNYAFTQRFDSYSITNKALVAFLENYIFSIYLCMCILISVPIFFLSFFPLSPPFSISI